MFGRRGYKRLLVPESFWHAHHRREGAEEVDVVTCACFFLRDVTSLDIHPYDTSTTFNYYTRLMATVLFEREAVKVRQAM